ncbi:MAG: hypothetical protein JO053_14860 [Acidobacteria bacterium]|nr:hypothetical protein [Acidobacteriota bacterium]
MGEKHLEKRGHVNSLDKVQYTLAFGIVGVLLYLVGFPVFLLFFFGLIAYFVWKMFAPQFRPDSRRIFEFYIRANEMLRDDTRRWFGFEMREAIREGSSIATQMGGAPPLLDFCLGALNHKIGDESSALEYLEPLAHKADRDESNIVFPSKELREHVRILRKIERAPAEAPLTSAALRSLERMRKNHFHQLLQEARAGCAKSAELVETTKVADPQELRRATASVTLETVEEEKPVLEGKRNLSRKNSERQTISEVLHEIYDGNVH